MTSPKVPPTVSPTVPPKVSVVIPNYNHARFLDSRLRSVLSQTFQDFEIVYLDDASSDDSEDVVCKYLGEPRLRAVRNARNSGSPFKQWNKGVRRARGRYIWIAESDDYADERLLETLVRQLDENPTVGIAYCQSNCLDEDGAALGTMEWWTQDLDAERWKHDFLARGREECRSFLAFKNTIPNASAVVFRRDVYERAGGADETMRLCGDWLLWSRMLRLADLSYVAEPLNFFRVHQRSVRVQSERDGRLAEESFRVLDSMRRRCVVPRPTLRRAAAVTRLRWLEGALSAPNRVPWKREWRLLRLARRVDARFGLYMALRLAVAALHALRAPRYADALSWRIKHFARAAARADAISTIAPPKPQS